MIKNKIHPESGVLPITLRGKQNSASLIYEMNNLQVMKYSDLPCTFISSLPVLEVYQTALFCPTRSFLC
jgi:hypothetical protein